jgi:DNA helicase-2/ATP-dependent DNA helicase PcrA
MIKSFSTRLNKTNAYDLADEIAKVSGLHKELYSDKTPEGVSRYENVQELLNGIKEFTDQNSTEEKLITLPDFLIDVALLTDADNDNPEDKDKVTLMTIHSAKGLEFPYVYIVGMEENLFPSQLSINTRSELEEERRLFYVAVTRAEKRCTLTYATSRYRWGQVTQCEPSRFIEEIDKKYLDMTLASREQMPFHLSDEDSSFSGNTGNPFRNQAFLNKYKSTGTSTPASSKPEPKPNFGVPKNLKKITGSTTAKTLDNSKIIPGVQVNHDRFGKGKVLTVEDGKATVFFPLHGQKQLLLQFAKLEIID